MEKANDLLDENLWPLPRHTPKRCRAAKNRKGGPALSQRLRGPLNREWLSLEIWRLCRSQPLPEQGIRAVPRGAEDGAATATSRTEAWGQCPQGSRSPQVL